MDIDWKNESNERLVCFCSQVNKKTVVEAILNGASEVKMIQKETKAGVGKRCHELNPSGRCCHSDLKALLNIYGTKKSDNNASDCCCCSN